MRSRGSSLETQRPATSCSAPPLDGAGLAKESVKPRLKVDGRLKGNHREVPCPDPVAHASWGPCGGLVGPAMAPWMATSSARLSIANSVTSRLPHALRLNGRA